MNENEFNGMMVGKQDKTIVQAKGKQRTHIWRRNGTVHPKPPPDKKKRNLLPKNDLVTNNSENTIGITASKPPLRQNKNSSITRNRMAVTKKMGEKEIKTLTNRKQSKKEKSTVGKKIQEKIKTKTNPRVKKSQHKTKTEKSNTDNKRFVEKAVGRDEVKEERVKKDSIAHMASLLDESNITPVEKQSGIFEEIKDTPGTYLHTIVGGRSKFKHRDSLNLYKDGYQPGHSMLYYPSNNIKPKIPNHGFHLSLNESTMSFLGTSTSAGFLEMSSGLVINNPKENHGFHISLDALDNSEDYNSKSGVFIKNQIFNKNNQWDIQKTSPGRVNKPEFELNLSISHPEADVIDNASYSNFKNSLSLPHTQKEDVKSPSLSRNSTRLSFLYNKHTGFICKHCFVSNCEHMDKMTPLASPQKEHTLPISTTSETKNEQVGKGRNNTEENVQSNIPVNNDEKIVSLERRESKDLDDIEIDMLLENLREKLNKNLSNVIELSDLLKFIKLKQVYHEDKTGNMVAYKEFVLDFDNSTASDNSDEIENELLNLSLDETTRETTHEKTPNKVDNDVDLQLDISGSALRNTPRIQTEQKLPPMSKKDPGAKQISHDVMLYYDSDYDDASYLNACALSKSNYTFEKYDLTNDLFYANVESDAEKSAQVMPITPPLHSSSPAHYSVEPVKQSPVKRKLTLRPTSELQTVFETEVAHHCTPRVNSARSSAESNQSGALTNVTADLDDLIEFADNLLESCSPRDENTKKVSNTNNPENKTNKQQNNTNKQLNNGTKQQLSRNKSEESIVSTSTKSIVNNYDNKQQSNDNKTEESPRVSKYGDVTLPEPNVSTKKGEYLKRLARYSESNHHSTESQQQKHTDVIKPLQTENDESQLPYHKQVPDSKHYLGLDEEDQLQLWLQDVSKYQSNEDLISSEIAEKPVPENEGLNQSESIETNTNGISSNSNHTDSDTYLPDVSYKHIDVLVLDSRDDESIADVSTLHGNSARSAVDSGVGSHATENSKTTAGTMFDPLIEEQEYYHFQSKQGTNSPYSMSHDYQNLEMQNMMSPYKQFSNFDHPRNITEPMNDYPSYFASHANYLKTQNVRSDVNFHKPKPPSQARPTSKTFKRNFSASSSKSIESPTDSYVQKLNSLSMLNKQHVSPRARKTISHAYPSLLVRNDRDFSSILDDQRSITEQEGRVTVPKEEKLPSLSTRYKTSLPNIYHYRDISPRDFKSNRSRKFSAAKRQKLLEVKDEKHETTLYLTRPYMTSRTDSYLPFAMETTDIHLPPHSMSRYI